MKKEKKLIKTLTGLLVFGLTGCNYFFPSSSASSSEIESGQSTSDDTSVESSTETSTYTESSSEETTSEISSEISSESSTIPPYNFNSKYPQFDTLTEMGRTYKDKAKNDYFGCDFCPSIGEINYLVIPVYFADSSNYITLSNKENVREDIRKSFFGTTEEVGWRSLKGYYEELSNNKITINGVVAPWFSAPYTTAELAESTPANLLEDAVDSFFLNNGDYNRQDFDSDKNGFLDAVAFIYGSPVNQQIGLSGSNLWGYTSWIREHSSSKLNPTINVFTWQSYTFMYSGGSSAKNRSGTEYGVGDSRNQIVDARCFIHEGGHMFGIQDYYDYAGETSPAGGFSMQDNNVGSHDPFSALTLGWGGAYIPTESCYVKLNPFQEDKKVIILSESFNDVASPFDEYLILELYTPTGLNQFDTQQRYKNNYPKGTTKVGIRLWHVDARLFYVNKYSGEYGNTTLTADPLDTRGPVLHATTNSTGEDYLYIGDSRFADYDLLHLIRADDSEEVDTTTHLDNYSIFGDKAYFARSTYQDQFPNGKAWDDSSYIKWQFRVNLNLNDPENPEAYVECIKTK